MLEKSQRLHRDSTRDVLEKAKLQGQRTDGGCQGLTADGTSASWGWSGCSAPAGGGHGSVHLQNLPGPYGKKGEFCHIYYTSGSGLAGKADFLKPLLRFQHERGPLLCSGPPRRQWAQPLPGGERAGPWGQKP